MDAVRFQIGHNPLGNLQEERSLGQPAPRQIEHALVAHVVAYWYPVVSYRSRTLLLPQQKLDSPPPGATLNSIEPMLRSWVMTAAPCE